MVKAPSLSFSNKSEEISLTEIKMEAIELPYKKVLPTAQTPMCAMP